MVSEEELLRILSEWGKVEQKEPKYYCLYMDKEKVPDLVKCLIEKVGDIRTAAVTGMQRNGKFIVYYHLWIHPLDVMVSLVVESKDDHFPSLTPVIPGSHFHENEAFDLLGLKFEGHPYLKKKLILPEESPEDYYPLRKEE